MNPTEAISKTGVARLKHLFATSRSGKYPTLNRIKYGACCVSNCATRDGFIAPRERACTAVAKR